MTPLLPLRLQRRRTRGYRMPKDAVYVGRPTIFGNPFSSVDAYRDWLCAGRVTQVTRHHLLPHFLDVNLTERRRAVLARLPELRGKALLCWCPTGYQCHADVLLELSNVLLAYRTALHRRAGATHSR